MNYSFEDIVFELEDMGVLEDNNYLVECIVLDNLNDDLVAHTNNYCRDLRESYTHGKGASDMNKVIALLRDEGFDVEVVEGDYTYDDAIVNFDTSVTELVDRFEDILKPYDVEYSDNGTLSWTMHPDGARIMVEY